MTDPLPVLVVGIKKIHFVQLSFIPGKLSISSDHNIYHLQYQRDTRLERIFGMFQFLFQIVVLFILQDANAYVEN